MGYGDLRGQVSGSERLPLPVDRWQDRVSRMGGRWDWLRMTKPGVEDGGCKTLTAQVCWDRGWGCNEVGVEMEAHPLLRAVRHLMVLIGCTGTVYIQLWETPPDWMRTDIALLVVDMACRHYGGRGRKDGGLLSPPLREGLVAGAIHMGGAFGTDGQFVPMRTIPEAPLPFQFDTASAQWADMRMAEAEYTALAPIRHSLQHQWRGVILVPDVMVRLEQLSSSTLRVVGIRSLEDLTAWDGHGELRSGALCVQGDTERLPQDALPFDSHQNPVVSGLYSGYDRVIGQIQAIARDRGSLVVHWGSGGSPGDGEFVARVALEALNWRVQGVPPERVAAWRAAAGMSSVRHGLCPWLARIQGGHEIEAKNANRSEVQRQIFRSVGGVLLVRDIDVAEGWFFREIRTTLFLIERMGLPRPVLVLSTEANWTLGSGTVDGPRFSVRIPALGSPDQRRQRG